jgi:transposase
MARACLACSSPERRSIEKALIEGEPLRNIAKRVSISPAGLLRHKNHVANAIGKAQAQHEERLGETLLGEMQRVQRKAWELLTKTESEGDHRGSSVALREVRECLKSLGEMVAKAETANGGSAQDKQFDYSVLSDDELSALEALLAKVASRPARKPELLVPDTLAPIAKG